MTDMAQFLIIALFNKGASLFAYLWAEYALVQRWENGPAHKESAAVREIDLKQTVLVEPK